MSFFPIFAPGDYSPSVRASSGYAASSSETTHTVTLPSGYVAGDLLIMLICQSGSNATPTVSGWTAVDSDTSGSAGTDRALYIFKKVATSGSTQDVGTDNDTIAVQVYAIEAGTNVETNTNSGSSATPNPPALTPTWSVRPMLTIAAVATRSTTATVSPDGYTAITNQTSTANGNKTMASGWRATRTVTTINPDAFATDSQNYAAATIAIGYVS
jgi:hypothetical protein